MSEADDLYRVGVDASRRGDDRAQAEELLEEADRELAAEGLVLDPPDRPEYERTRELTALPERPG